MGWHPNQKRSFPGNLPKLGPFPATCQRISKPRDFRGRAGGVPPPATAPPYPSTKLAISPSPFRLMSGTRTPSDG